MSSICRLNISNTLYEISPSPDGILDNTKYVSNDKSNTTEYINVDPITTTETNSSIFSKITTMIRNIRYIWSRIGTTDISSIGDSITSALVNSNNIATTKADNNTYGQVKIGDGLIVQDGVISADFKSGVLDQLYPIGTIYESTKSVSPSTFLGGTWEEYGFDSVLVGRGPDHSIGSTGGHMDIFLTSSNLPEHSHTIQVSCYINHKHYVKFTYYDSVRHYDTFGALTWKSDKNYVNLRNSMTDNNYETVRLSDLGSTSVTGSSYYFNIEQPYVTVYRWRRTA